MIGRWSVFESGVWRKSNYQRSERLKANGRASIKSAMSRLRTLLILGRVSNLPTVWSDCLAGWWLGGGGNFQKLPFLFSSATLLYIGGMFLNDAFDAAFDQQHRKERPIPSQKISEWTVWSLGILWLVLGSTGLFWIGLQTGLLGLALLLCILIYEAIHKLMAFSSVVMGLCRFFLYVVAASTGINGVTGSAVWCGLALASYIVGLSFLARRESARGPVQYWPLIFLAAPLLLAQLMNAGGFARPAFLLGSVFALWMAQSLRFVFRPIERNIGRAISNLLAGIVLVDLLANPDMPRELTAIFLLLFALALFFQRFIPAT
jgi:4-hydroxybenzoate polyprenyltransferase